MGSIEVVVHVKDGTLRNIRINCADRNLNEITERWMHRIVGHYFEYENIKHITEECIAEQSGKDKCILSLIAYSILERI